MAEDDGDDRNLVQRAADTIKDAVTDPNLERALANQAAAMPGASGDLNFAAGASPFSGPAAGFTPGAGAAAAGSLTDEEPVGRTGDAEDERDR
jgi:hypothetical protein